MTESKPVQTPPFSRWVMHLVVGTLVGIVMTSLLGLVGKLLEQVPVTEFKNYLYSVQKSAFDGVSAFEPSLLGTLFFCSFAPPSEGDCLPPPQATAETLSRIGAQLEQEGPGRGSPIADGTLNERIERNLLTPTPPRTLIGLGHWGRYLPWPWGILLAAPDLLFHLVVNATLTASLFAVAQFVLGFLAMDGFGAKLLGLDKDGFGYLLIFLGAILLGCAFGYVTKWVMIGGLRLLTPLTHLGGISSGVGMLGGFSFIFGFKVIETAVHETMTETVEKRVSPE